MARRASGQKANTRRANWRRAGLLRGRLGRITWSAAAVSAVLLAIGELRQSALFYPVVRPFDRVDYQHWVDADGNCRDTRTEVLVLESLELPRMTGDGCGVVAGRWYDPYTGRTITDPRELDVDHRIPLAEAHRSGADRWDAARRRAFANDLSHPDTLVAVDLSANRAKADGDPLSWMPPAWGNRCAYVQRWRETKRRWGLGEDLLESWFNDGVLWLCDRLGARWPVG